MSKENRYRRFNPEAEQHSQLKNAIISDMEDQSKYRDLTTSDDDSGPQINSNYKKGNRIATPLVAKGSEVQKVKKENNFSSKYLRYHLLPGALHWMLDEDILEKSKEQLSGKKTHMWSLK